MALSIDKTKACVVAVGDVCVDSIAVIMHKEFLKVFKVIASVKVLIESAPESVKELKDLDPAEMKELAGSSVALVLRVIEAVKK